MNNAFSNSILDNLLQLLPKEYRGKLMLLQNASTLLSSTSRSQSSIAGIDNTFEKYMHLICDGNNPKVVGEKLLAEILEVLRIKRDQIKLIDKLEEEILGLQQNITHQHKVWAMNNRPLYVEEKGSLREEMVKDDKMQEEIEDEYEPPSKRTNH